MLSGQTNLSKINNKQKISQLQQKVKNLCGRTNFKNYQTIQKSSQAPLSFQNQKEQNKIFEIRQMNTPQNTSYLKFQNCSENQSSNSHQYNTPLSLNQNYQNNYSPKFNNIKNKQKISNSQTLVKSDISPLETKYGKIQQKFVRFKLQQQTLINNIEKQITQLNDQTKTFKRDSERIFSKNQELSDQLQKQLSVQILQMSQEIKQLKKGVISSIDTKYKTIKTQMMTHIYQEFQISCQAASEELTHQIEHLQNKVQEDKVIRDQVSSLLINTFGDEILKLEQVFNHQKQMRIQKYQQIFDMISKFQNKFDLQLNKQRKQRNSHFQILQNTLEEVCFKIQQRILGR